MRFDIGKKGKRAVLQTAVQQWDGGKPLAQKPGLNSVRHSQSPCVTREHKAVKAKINQAIKIQHEQQKGVGTEQESVPWGDEESLQPLVFSQALKHPPV